MAAAALAIQEKPAANVVEHIAAAELARRLEAANESRPGLVTMAIRTSEKERMHFVRRTRPADAAIHETDGAEIHYITEGAGTLVTGGTLVREAGKPATIQGGVSRRVTKGDAIVIPGRTPHWYSAVEGSVTYLEVRTL